MAVQFKCNNWVKGIKKMQKGWHKCKLQRRFPKLFQRNPENPNGFRRSPDGINPLTCEYYRKVPKMTRRLSKFTEDWRILPEDVWLFPKITERYRSWTEDFRTLSQGFQTFSEMFKIFFYRSQSLFWCDPYVRPWSYHYSSFLILGCGERGPLNESSYSASSIQGQPARFAALDTSNPSESRGAWCRALDDVGGYIEVNLGTR